METPQPPEGIIEGYRALGDATGIISDVMDELGITGVVGAAALKPTIAGACIVGPALTRWRSSKPTIWHARVMWW